MSSKTGEHRFLDTPMAPRGLQRSQKIEGQDPCRSHSPWAAERDLGDRDIPSRRDVHTVNITVAAALCTRGSESYKTVESMTARENLGASLGTFGPSLDSQWK